MPGPLNYFEQWDKIFLVLFLMGVFLLRKNYYTKNKIKIMFSGILTLPFIFVSLMSVAFAIIPQNTPEAAFLHHNNCHMDAVIDGEKSAITLNKTNSVVTISHFYKSDKGYKIAYGFVTKDLVSNFAENKIYYSVEEFKKTGERYITIFDLNTTVSELSDCNGTEFYAVEHPDSVVYYGYIGTDDDYWFEIDGVKIYPLKEKS